MDRDLTEKRRSERLPCTGVVTLQVSDGDHKGASLVGLVVDISDSGICIILDGGQFQRGCAVRIEFSDGLQLTGLVSHSQRIAEGSRVGIAFSPVVSETGSEELTVQPVNRDLD